MITPESVDSLDHPELAPFRTLRRSAEHRRQGLFVAEGGAVVERLLATELEVVSLLLSRTWLDRLAPALSARSRAPAVWVAEHRLLERIVGFPLHQGAMALARIPPQPSLDAVLEEPRKPWLLLAIDDVTNTENVGTMVRSAAALDATAVIAGDTCASPWLRRAVRASMGSAFAVPICETNDLAGTLYDLRWRDVACLAAAPRGAPPAADVDMTTSCCLVVGHEGRGLRSPIRAACTGAVTIPMAVGADSLNVAAAAAVLLYEARRQRTLGNVRR